MITADQLPIVLRHDGYWIEPTEAVSAERMGPYDEEHDAEHDREGVLTFLRNLDAGRNPFE